LQEQSVASGQTLLIVMQPVVGKLPH